MTTKQDAEKSFQKGLSELKTSVFKLKFNPDYLSAVPAFEKAAKLFEENKDYQSAIKSYLKALECNKKLLESWAEGQNFLKIAEIYFFKLDNTKEGFKYLQEAQVSFKLAGKYHTSLKILIDLSNKLSTFASETQQKKFNEIAVSVLEEAWVDALNNTENEMIRIAIDDLHSKLFDCYLNIDFSDYNKAIKITNDYIKTSSGFKSKKAHKIVNAYAKLTMLYLINKEFSNAEGLVDKANSVADSSTYSDIDDLKDLVKSFKEKNTKKLNYCITYCYHLFERNLLKSLKKAYDDYCSEGSKSEDFLGGGVNNADTIDKNITDIILPENNDKNKADEMNNADAFL